MTYSLIHHFGLSFRYQSKVIGHILEAFHLNARRLANGETESIINEKMKSIAIAFRTTLDEYKRESTSTQHEHTE